MTTTSLSLLLVYVAFSSMRPTLLSRNCLEKSPGISSTYDDSPFGLPESPWTSTPGSLANEPLSKTVARTTVMLGFMWMSRRIPVLLLVFF